MIWTKEEYEAEVETRILATRRVLRGIAYNPSKKGKCANTNEGKTTGNCETEKENTEVENDKKVSLYTKIKIIKTRVYARLIYLIFVR